MSLTSFIYAFGSLQGVILCAVFLLAPNLQRPSNYFMAGLTGVISLRLLQNWLIESGFFLAYPQWAISLMPATFLWGPLLYLYACSLTSRPWRWQQLAHGLPFVAVLLLTADYYDFPMQTQQQVIDYIWYNRHDVAVESNVAALLPAYALYWIKYAMQANAFILHFGIYCVLVLRVIKQHNQVLQGHFSSLETMNLRWLKWLTLACVFYLMLFLVFERLPRLLSDEVQGSTVFRYFFLVLLIYAIAIAAMFQPNIIRGIQAAQQTSNEDNETAHGVEHNPATEKYHRSGLSAAEATAYKQLLQQIMTQDQVYMDSELTLPTLASKAGLSSHQVSQVINEHVGQNFYGFVNEYRIEKAKQLLLDPQTSNMAVVDLAMEVGFKSKSSFYDAFKKSTHMTPTQFKKQA